MKKALLALALSLIASSANAVCSQIPLNVKDASSNTVAMSSASAADGNCKTYIDADTSSQLHTDLTAAVAAGENHLGEVGGNMLPINSAMTTTAATITTGQSIGGLQTLANAVRVSGTVGNSGTTGLIQDVVLGFADAVTGTAIDVYYFTASPTGTTCTNGSAFVLGATAAQTQMIGVVHVADFTASNTAVIGQAHNLAMSFGLGSATSIFACVVARGSFTTTSTQKVNLQTNILRN